MTSDEWIDDFLDDYPYEVFKHHGDMHSNTNWGAIAKVKKNAKQAITQKLQEVERLARVDELRTFVAQLENNHHDMPIGTASLYVHEQYLARLNHLTPTSHKGDSK